MVMALYLGNLKGSLILHGKYADMTHPIGLISLCHACTELEYENLCSERLTLEILRKLHLKMSSVYVVC